MDLRGRLDMLGRSAPAQSTPRPALMSLEQVLGGEVRQNDSGAFFFRQQRLPIALRHGPRTLGEALRVQPGELAGLDSRLESLDLKTALYLDTETTGLAGGSGTYAFLVGLAYFRDEELVVEQLLMREHCEEKAMLHYLAERVEQSSGLVTFNGKTFDAQLLDTRFCLNRMRVRLEDEAHLDLLPVARRLWSKALPDCRLETLERELLGLPRGEDIPGWMIPQVYFRFLQRRDPRGLGLVAEHNRRDILAMVGLVAGLGGYWREPHRLQHRFRPDLTHFEDYSLGRFFFRTRRLEWAQELLERAFRGGAASPVAGESPRQGREAWLGSGALLARLWSRQGRTEDACRVWQTILELQPHHDSSLEGLAKHFEHQAKDFPRALSLADLALAIPTLTRGRRGNWQRRRERLQRRLDSAS